LNFKINESAKPDRRQDPLTGRWANLEPISASELKKLILKSRERFSCNNTPEAHAEWCYCCSDQGQLTYPDITSMDTEFGRIRVTTERSTNFKVTEKLQREGKGVYNRMNPYGADETVIIGNQHDTRISNLPVELLAHSLSVCQDRILDLNQDLNLINIISWANGNYLIDGHGYSHPQWHITSSATPYRRVVEVMTNSFEYYFIWEKQRCLMCDIIRQDLSEKELIIAETEQFVVLAPYASRYSFEIWFVPKEHTAVFEDSGKDARNRIKYWQEFANLIQQTVVKLEALLGNHVPYTLLLFNPPRKFHYRSPHSFAPLSREQIKQSFHWRLRLIPDLSSKSRHEKTTGESTITIVPAQAAELLRLSAEQLQEIQ